MSEHLVEGWRMPIVPVGFDVLVACQYPDNFELDFVNETTREFASESKQALPSIPWPWRAGYNPTPADWRRLGISIIDFT
jgi:hypothetical protein